MLVLKLLFQSVIVLFLGAVNMEIFAPDFSSRLYKTTLQKADTVRKLLSGSFSPAPTANATPIVNATSTMNPTPTMNATPTWPLFPEVTTSATAYDQRVCPAPLAGLQPSLGSELYNATIEPTEEVRHMWHSTPATQVQSLNTETVTTVLCIIGFTLVIIVAFAFFKFARTSIDVPAQYLRQSHSVCDDLVDPEARPSSYLLKSPGPEFQLAYKVNSTPFTSTAIPPNTRTPPIATSAHTSPLDPSGNLEADRTKSKFLPDNVIGLLIPCHESAGTRPSRASSPTTTHESLMHSLIPSSTTGKEHDDSNASSPDEIATTSSTADMVDEDSEDEFHYPEAEPEEDEFHYPGAEKEDPANATRDDLIGNPIAEVRRLSEAILQAGRSGALLTSGSLDPSAPASDSTRGCSMVPSNLTPVFGQASSASCTSVPPPIDPKQTLSTQSELSGEPSRERHHEYGLATSRREPEEAGVTSTSSVNDAITRGPSRGAMPGSGRQSHLEDRQQLDSVAGIHPHAPARSYAEPRRSASMPPREDGSNGNVQAPARTPAVSNISLAVPESRGDGLNRSDDAPARPHLDSDNSPLMSTSSPSKASGRLGLNASIHAHTPAPTSQAVDSIGVPSSPSRGPGSVGKSIQIPASAPLDPTPTPSTDRGLDKSIHACTSAPSDYRSSESPLTPSRGRGLSASIYASPRSVADSPSSPSVPPRGLDSSENTQAPASSSSDTDLSSFARAFKAMPLRHNKSINASTSAPSDSSSSPSTPSRLRGLGLSASIHTPAPSASADAHGSPSTSSGLDSSERIGAPTGPLGFDLNSGSPSTPSGAWASIYAHAPTSPVPTNSDARLSSTSSRGQGSSPRTHRGTRCWQSHA
ncbi:uncharacterized protein C8Q71DRAFT_880650 [Rhodofomes roseus]|uniref:Uncharacterized protein n=1 Tax=Rhodofomes roseus TaxID=34475 RepID=A0ABQ8K4Z1_9APHY|nr:uncharacterized protein C8Q71DRAFT_880650 [Rhodofomes roseus]KAH9832031.1 hypothetical protein C8Q71DRAFT_880650 [Rhodofomes roseus]